MKNKSTSISEESFKTFLQEKSVDDYVRLGDVRERLEFVTSVLKDVEPPSTVGDFILILKDNKEKSWFHLQKSIVNIGRSKKADLTLPDNSISRFHCRLEKNDNLWTITDTDSKNGISVNGQKTKNRILCDGDIIKTGAFNVIFMRF